MDVYDLDDQTSQARAYSVPSYNSTKEVASFMKHVDTEYLISSSTSTVLC